MEKIKEKARQVWEAITYPYGINEEYDRQCDNAFLKLVDRVVVFSWCLYGIVAIISLYFFITRELL